MNLNQAGRWRNQKKSGQNIPLKPTDGARLSMIPPHGLPRNHGTRLIRDLLQEMSGKSLGLQVTQIILVNSWLCLKLDCTGLRLGAQNSWRVSFKGTIRTNHQIWNPMVEVSSWTSVLFHVTSTGLCLQKHHHDPTKFIF